MGNVLSSRNLSKTYASDTLFTGVSLQILEEDRLGVIGPNGAGKSTLVRILAGRVTPDSGETTCRRGLRRVYVPQDDRFEDDATPRSVVLEQLAPSDPGPRRLDVETRAAITLSKLGFTDIDQPVATLSGGWRKRLSIARALAQDPEVLMLDEPTNHLDLEGIIWLERFVQEARMAIVLVTHDRRFLENVALRIVELSPAYPGGCFEVAGNYTEFVRRKSAFLDAQDAAESSLANKVRRDTAWLLQGIQGRQTRNKSQVDDSAKRRVELKSIRGRNEAPKLTAAIDFQATERKTKKLLTLHRVTKSMGGTQLFGSLDLMLSPGRRIGLLGKNGSGKTTLLRLMSGDLEPETGTIKRADDLRVVTFNQDRGDLETGQALQEALCPVGNTVDYRGKPIHVTGWAKKFLFTPDQLSTLVGNLSGGEQARVLIANLMLEPADILLLDEPTNDLDIASLEVLEQALLEFPGAIVLVTHDRFMLERISTEFLALDGRGGAASYVSYAQWQTAQQRDPINAPRSDVNAIPRSGARKTRSVTGPKKLSYNLQRELDGMENAILEAEAEVERLQTAADDPVMIADHVRLAEGYRELHDAQDRVQKLYERWAQLDAMQRP